MARWLVIPMLALAALAASAIADATESDAIAPDYDLLLFDPAALPQAVVRTASVDEDEWRVIGRELRERAPSAGEFVVFFYAAGSPDLPPDYATSEEAKGRSERWLIGSYQYIGPHARARRFDPDRPEEFISQSRIKAREVEIDGLRVIELGWHDSPESPDVIRSAGATVAAPDLEPATLDAIVAHYKARFGTPRVFKVMVFDGEPDWPAKPVITPDMDDHPHLCYRLSQDAERVEGGWKLTPREPEWLVVGEGGTLVPADPPAEGE